LLNVTLQRVYRCTVVFSLTQRKLSSTCEAHSAYLLQASRMYNARHQWRSSPQHFVFDKKDWIMNPVGASRGW
jgi:hypothetical protein